MMKRLGIPKNKKQKQNNKYRDPYEPLWANLV